MINKIIKILIISLLFGCQNDLSRNESSEVQNQNDLKTVDNLNISIDSTSTDISLINNSVPPLTNKSKTDSIFIDTNFTTKDFTYLYDEIKELGFIKFRDKDKELYSEPKYKIIETLLKRFKHKSIIKKDSLIGLLLNRSKFYGLNEITNLLYTHEIAYQSVDTTFTGLIINTNDFNNLSSSLRISIFGKVLSKSFESTTFDRKTEGFTIPEGYHLFSGSNYHRNRFSIGTDTIILIMSDDGFEMSSHIITVWSELDNKIELISILDHFYVVGIGGIYIEEVITINSKKKIIVGRESGADGDQMWGSLWLFVWEYPRFLRRIYEIDYDSENHIYMQKVDYSIAYDTMQLFITKTHYNIKETDYDSEITDSIITRESISIDSIIDFDIYESIYR